MVHPVRFKSGARKVSPPQATFMNDEQLAQYLQDLRNNRPSRPNGSRPLPTKGDALTPDPREAPPRASSALSMSRPSEMSRGNSPFPRSSSALSHRRHTSELSPQNDTSEFHGIPEDEVSEIRRNVSFASTVPSVTSPSGYYRENGHRLIEKQEARSLRNALEEMDLQDEERRLFDAAQEEAVELVLQHQKYGFPEENPLAPYHNPDMKRPNPFQRHFQNRSPTVGKLELHQSESENPVVTSPATALEDPFRAPNGKKIGDSDTTLSARQNLKIAARRDERHDALQSKVNPKTSGTRFTRGLFRNPEDQIYEEPEQSDSQNEKTTNALSSTTSALRPKPKNSLPRGARPLPGRFNTTGSEAKSVFDRYKSPLVQSKNPLYKTNSFPVTPSIQEKEDTTPMKEGLEIRGDDIRAATSMKLKDRSSKLPMPSAVSDAPGRPIVSFDPDWKAPEKEALSDSRGVGHSAGESSPQFAIETSSSPKTTGPSTINGEDRQFSDIPAINIAGEESAGPSIVISELGPPISAMTPQQVQKPRELPDPKKYSQQQRAKKSAATQNRYNHITPTNTNGPTATCAACSLPISGRIVTACKNRLHPECFTCDHCNTPLECVAFYQEPETNRADRLANSDDGDLDATNPRFYCHLDFHELFSPRCKSCKTPIEGEVIVACGAEWHVGHFFCAECGDPFTPQTPFIEKEGYAWCVRCHSRRTADKCRACKLPVLEEVIVTALGGQWHEKCFVCCECGGGFGPEGRFFVRQGKARFTAKGRQIGGPVDTAACEACEARRLKA
ncbi:hypothetical protein LOZ39_000462 [Ophidiomyces ophidiicola]|uniref:Uncharacterized protein n=1 Tax=Ophidiomyces ophidiicola TaxID=1387563 RepID=A0ACB8V320_9EURO|nr:uncharacterized protein LOZ57_000103 [Ophidiomyces ophidiicola]KAI1922173.1 hypothetical protein LOZ64_001286 [Ophidiomyces ophidiicola]KAI1953762.1 hypothetical protein LOZ57_000103 [Ophidiomyces ophidiicola]KAI1954828.1 hypothetical protein LOZ62_000605 [Ophidiomyces ophidiicola]KAI2011015.1 hypothetical protein LOZ50_000810 [Ophidiomyces ophidiicola]KAI2014513.1 hypothetical protein LOZ49_001260 [Ophidiomyces ophidiicola]